jgi:hypothetical protein
VSKPNPDDDLQLMTPADVERVFKIKTGSQAAACGCGEVDP